MSLSAAVLATDISQMMVKLVNQHVRVVEVFLARNVDRLLTMDVASERPLLPPRKSHSEGGHFHSIVLGEELERVLWASLYCD